MGLFRTADLGPLADAPLTYPEVGATRSDPLPEDYAHLERSGVVGHGRDGFERASAAVLDWGAQRGVGLRVRASGPANHEGTVAVLTAALPWLGYDIPCRVVWARSVGDERGFAYGTLPGHPESGEEAFVVHLTDAGDVVFTVRAFSHPATLLARLGGPLTPGSAERCRRAVRAGHPPGGPCVHAATQSLNSSPVRNPGARPGAPSGSGSCCAATAGT